MTYFIISDIHSHYNAMVTALLKSGYNSENTNHHLIVVGDLFDRGKQPKEVLEFLYQLNLEDKASIIIGNHDTFLLDFLKGNHKRVLFNIELNGFGETLEYLSGMKPNEDNLDKIKEIIENEYSFLKNWLLSFPYYIELGNYIFVHGGIDGKMLDWKTMSSKRDFVWNREHDLTPIDGKIVVAGHHRVATIRKKTDNYHLLFQHNPEMFDILYKKGKILIDRYVEVSNEINVLKLDI